MKRISIFLLCLCLALSLCACGSGGGQKTGDINFEDCSRELLDSDAFSDMLSPVTAEVAEGLYQIDAADIEDVQLYISTLATAEEIGLFKASSADAANRIQDAIQTRIQAQIEAYSDYGPEEVPKLEKAIVKSRDLYVVYVTADNNESVESVLSKYF